MSKKNSQTLPDLNAELANTPTVETTDTPADTVTAEEQEQLNREKEMVTKIEAGSTVAQAIVAVETEDERVAREVAANKKRREEAGVQYYFATGDRTITDPETGKVFGPDKPTKSELTGWVEFQLESGKLRKDEA